MKIYQVTRITDEIVKAFERLIPQLSSDLLSPTQSFLEEIVSFEGTHLFVAEDNMGVILATLTLVIYKIPTGKKARVEDVIVDSSARGRGVASLILKASLEFAQKEGIQKVDLTSNPSREAAHVLYRKMGFEERNTSVFRLLLD